MDKSQEIAELIVEIRDLLREGAKRQGETLEFLRAEAERTKAVVDRSVALQEISLQRQKTIHSVVLPVIVIALGVLGWLLFKL